MSYIHKTSGQYPVTERDIKALPQYATRTWPTPFVAPDEYAWVFPKPSQPYDSLAQGVREADHPVLTELGTYEQAWEVYDMEPEQAEANLAAAKVAKNAEINAARLTANFTAFPHAGKLFACDQLSRSDIDGTNGYVALNGVLPQGWPGGWKAVDNTYVAISTVDDWKAFYASMFAQGNANFAKAQTLKAALEAATTGAEIAAISWGD